MCGENEPKIPVYWVAVNGMAGPCEKTVNGVLDDVQTELEEHAIGGGEKVITIRTGEMKAADYEALPEFEGY